MRNCVTLPAFSFARLKRLHFARQPTRRGEKQECQDENEVLKMAPTRSMPCDFHLRCRGVIPAVGVFTTSRPQMSSQLEVVASATRGGKRRSGVPYSCQYWGKNIPRAVGQMVPTLHRWKKKVRIARITVPTNVFTCFTVMYVYCFCILFALTAASI